MHQPQNLPTLGKSRDHLGANLMLNFDIMVFTNNYGLTRKKPHLKQPTRAYKNCRMAGIVVAYVSDPNMGYM